MIVSLLCTLVECNDSGGFAFRDEKAEGVTYMMGRHLVIQEWL